MSADERARGVIAFLSGNHAQGVAHAARLCGTAATIIMSEDAPKLKLANIHAPTVPRSSPVTGSVKAERKSTAKSPSEPGGAVALATALGDQLPADVRTMVVTASGGNVDQAVFQAASPMPRPRQKPRGSAAVHNKSAKSMLSGRCPRPDFDTGTVRSRKLEHISVPWGHLKFHRSKSENVLQPRGLSAQIGSCFDNSELDWPGDERMAAKQGTNKSAPNHFSERQIAFGKIESGETFGFSGQGGDLSRQETI